MSETYGKVRKILGVGVESHPIYKMTELTHCMLKEILRYNRKTGLFTWKKHRCSNIVGKTAGTLLGTGYIELSIFKTHYLAHRVAWFYVNGAWPKAGIDHRDGVRSNNAFKNLREATQRENCRNKIIQKNCKSGIQGVCWDVEKCKWRAYVNVDGKHTHLGRFDSIEEAAVARKAGALLAHGEFAYLARPKP
jgi:hypothetical protein